MIYSNIIDTIGNTPIVKLNHLVSGDMADVYVKIEFFNPTSSVKDRIAKAMIERAEENGDLTKDSVIIEPTSGNTGIGVAMVAAAKGYKCVLVMPDTMSIERRKILKAFGTELVLTEGAKGMKGAVDKTNELVEQNENYIPLHQFDNPANPLIHRNTTGQEIINDFDSLDAFVAGIGTGGTITGTGETLKNHFNDIKVYAVEPNDSAVLSGEGPGPHKIQGIGAGFVPSILNTDIYDDVIRVDNDIAFGTSRDLAYKEGILSGISSGANVFAAIEVAKKLGKGKKVLTIICDTGERYLSTTMFGDQ
ncbi:cysteine synthase A [Haloplasma contractile]|uniref:Cysteine synthase n=1 Tax=Haloplasma contractile SSD-17B TaxID=1033810 RepID=F7PT26_9MOLU|nr:cysteine synthase A [Haloplasma contractile]ERJ12562.1 Cysteine synthase protein [Haloplasma contractile SSD-17B]